MKVRLLTIDAASEGQRLDNFLLRVLKGVPKSHVYRVIRAGEVRVNKGRAQAETKLALGDVVRVPPVRVAERSEAGEGNAAPPAPPRTFELLYEDEHFIAINKPAGVAVHGGSGVSFGVIEQLRTARALGLPGGAKFLELVHRLDKETSGVLLVAKRRSALVALQEQFKTRTARKTYLAVALGDWPAKLKVIDQALHKFVVPGGDPLDAEGERRVKTVANDDPNGMRAITLVKVAARVALPDELKGGRAASLLEVTIKTGRTHQIRVHLASNGHPILGDEKYGDFEANKQLARMGFKRMYLHAWQLTISHPATGQEVHITSPSPAGWPQAPVL